MSSTLGGAVVTTVVAGTRNSPDLSNLTSGAMWSNDPSMPSRTRTGATVGSVTSALGGTLYVEPKCCYLHTEDPHIDEDCSCEMCSSAAGTAGGTVVTSTGTVAIAHVDGAPGTSDGRLNVTTSTSHLAVAPSPAHRGTWYGTSDTDGHNKKVDIDGKKECVVGYDPHDNSIGVARGTTTLSVMTIVSRSSPSGLRTSYDDRSLAGSPRSLRLTGGASRGTVSSTT